MPVFRDRVKDSSTSTGTGDFTLSGTAPTGYRAFSPIYSVNDVFLYCIEDMTSGLWETGTGYLSATTTLVRDTVFDGSSGEGVLVNFTSGTKNVFVTAPSHWLEDADNGAVLAKSRGWDMP
jgi:hypothetical protein